MKDIGIIGAGIAGLHLGLFLQQHGVRTTLYSDRTPDQLRASRLPNMVARFGHTRAREQALGVDHWNFPDFMIEAVHLRIEGQPPLSFCGHPAQPWSFVDMRIYCATLLEEYAARGGRVVVGPVQAADVARLAQEHALMVVAAGRGSLAAMFPPLVEHSPYTTPQRHLLGGLFRGIAHIREPLGFSYTVVPGQGEIFNAPFYSFAGRVSNLLFEGIPGQGFAPLMQLRYEEEPDGFNAAVLAALRTYAPAVYERVDPAEFGLTGPLDTLQGYITPCVRRGYVPLGDGKFAIALGDMHVLNDPIQGQGANAASHAAWVLGAAILEDLAFDERFCRRVERRIWDYVEAVTEWSNAALQPPPPHMIEVFVAAAQNPAIADALIDNFNAPVRQWDSLATPQRAAAFLRQFAAPVGLPTPRPSVAVPA